MANSVRRNSQEIRNSKSLLQLIKNLIESLKRLLGLANFLGLEEVSEKLNDFQNRLLKFQNEAKNVELSDDRKKQLRGEIEKIRADIKSFKKGEKNEKVVVNLDILKNFSSEKIEQYFELKREIKKHEFVGVFFARIDERNNNIGDISEATYGDFKDQALNHFRVKNNIVKGYSSPEKSELIRQFISNFNNLYGNKRMSKIKSEWLKRNEEKEKIYNSMNHLEKDIVHELETNHGGKIGEKFSLKEYMWKSIEEIEKDCDCILCNIEVNPNKTVKYLDHVQKEEGVFVGENGKG